METYEASIEKVIWPSQADDESRRGEGQSVFYILSVRGVVNTTAKGICASRPAKDEEYTFWGRWTTWNGTRQFQFARAEIHLPVDEQSMLLYACKLTNGLGDKMAEQIWDARHEDWRNVTDGEIRGLTYAKVLLLRESIKRIALRKEEAQAIGWLISLGASTNLATLAFQAYEGNTVSVVKKNCYELANLPNYGFADIDGKVRIALGIANDDPRRLRACIVYVMQQLSANGDTLISADWLLQEATTKLGNRQLAFEGINSLIATSDLVAFEHEQALSLRRVYNAELKILDYQP